MITYENAKTSDKMLRNRVYQMMVLYDKLREHATLEQQYALSYLLDDEIRKINIDLLDRIRIEKLKRKMKRRIKNEI